MSLINQFACDNFVYILLCFQSHLFPFSFVKSTWDVPWLTSTLTLVWPWQSWSEINTLWHFVMPLKGSHTSCPHSLFIAYVNAFAAGGFVIASSHCFVFVAIKGKAHGLNLLSHFPLTFSWCFHPGQLYAERACRACSRALLTDRQCDGSQRSCCCYGISLESEIISLFGLIF